MPSSTSVNDHEQPLHHSDNSFVGDMKYSAYLAPERHPESKLMSPPSLSASVTPPPSSHIPPQSASMPLVIQAQDERIEQRHTLTPSLPTMSSPPPTVGGPVASRREPSHVSEYNLPTANHMTDASPAELRTLLQNSVSEVDRLKALLRDAQTSAAHFKLQYKLLSIESDETAMRMAVEQDMIKREVDFLRSAEQKHKQHDQHERSMLGGQGNEHITQLALAPEMKQCCQMLQSENDVLRRRLRRAKKVILHRDGEIASLSEESDRLKSRIRENRELFNRLLRPGRSHESATSRNIDALVTTPGRMLQTRVGNSMAAQLGRTPTGGEDTFAALLLADQVLSQEHASAPTTPVRRRPPPPRPSHLGHHRGSQSLSSLPPVPRPSELAPQIDGGLLPPAQLAEPELRTVNVSVHAGKHDRRHSRDSTISASEVEASTPPTRHQSTGRGDIVQESQASQLARQILRRSPEMKRDGSSKLAEKTQSLSQAKIHGQARKPGVDYQSDEMLGKRKALHEAKRTDRQGSSEETRQTKRSKTAEVVGLGIRAWGSSRS